MLRDVVVLLQASGHQGTLLIASTRPMSSSTPKIQNSSYIFPPSLPNARTFGLQLTELTDTYLLWVGVVPSSAGELAPVPVDPLRDEDGGGSAGADLGADLGEGAGAEARLGRDWAVGMPGWGNHPPVGTALLRNAGEDLALSLSQRLARRFKKQVFLSVDVGDFGAGVGGAQGARVLLDVERQLVGVLSQVEKRKEAES